LHAANFELVVLIRISFEDNIDLSISIHIGYINQRPRRHDGNIHIRFLEWDVSQQNDSGGLIDGENHLAEHYRLRQCGNDASASVQLGELGCQTEK